MGYLGTEHSKLTLVVLSNIGVSSLSREPHSGNYENKGTGILKRQRFGLEKFAIPKFVKAYQDLRFFVHAQAMERC